MPRYLYILPLWRCCTLHSVGTRTRGLETDSSAKQQSFLPPRYADSSIYLFSVRVTLFHRDVIWQVRLITPTSLELVRSHRMNLSATILVVLCHLCTMKNSFLKNNIMSTCHRDCLQLKSDRAFHVSLNCRNTSWAIVLFSESFPFAVCSVCTNSTA